MGYLEASNTKNDLRNGFFSESWSYTTKGLNIFGFMKKMSAMTVGCNVNGVRSRIICKYNREWTFKLRSILRGGAWI